MVDFLHQELPHLRNGRHIPLDLILSDAGINTFESFGATGTGDDTAAMQLALNAYAGSVIVARPGRTYIISGPLTIPARTIVQWYGSGARLTDSSLSMFIMLSHSAFYGGVFDGGSLPTDITNAFPAIFVVTGDSVTLMVDEVKNARCTGAFITGIWPRIIGGEWHDIKAQAVEGYNGSGANLDRAAEFASMQMYYIGTHGITDTRGNNDRVHHNIIRGDQVTAYGVNVVPDESLGAVNISAVTINGASPTPDFTAYRAGNYLLVGTSWRPAAQTELTGYKRASDSLIYVAGFSSFTIINSNAGTALNTQVAHTLEIGMKVRFTRITGGGGAFDTVTTYFVKTLPTATSFTLSATLGGAAIAFGSAITTGFGGVYLVNAPASSGTGDLLNFGKCDRFELDSNIVSGGVGAQMIVYGPSANWKMHGNICYRGGGSPIVALYDTVLGGSPTDGDILDNTVIDSCRNLPAVYGTQELGDVLIVGVPGFPATVYMDGNTFRATAGAPPATLGKAVYPVVLVDGTSSASFVKVGRNLSSGHTHESFKGTLIPITAAAGGWGAGSALTALVDQGAAFSFRVTAGAGPSPNPFVSFETYSVPGEGVPLSASHCLMVATDDAAVLAGALPFINNAGSDILANFVILFTPNPGSYYDFIVRR